MPEFRDYVDIRDVRCIRETAKAILIEIPGYGEDLWIPQSQVDDRSEVWHEGDEGTLVISQWIADQKDL